MAIYLGIDTSNYTTSVAAVDDDGVIVADERIILNVEQGKRGLRQSDALFLHIKNLPVLFDRIGSLGEISAVGVSTAPRRTEGSYMPVFLSGYACASAIAKTHGAKLFEFSHQEGHLRAGKLNLAQDVADRFYAVHLSGGTTEILDVKCDGARFISEIIGGTQDISAGQLVDRIGVKLGLSFPCGKELEKLANQSDSPLKFKLSTKDCFVSFSGVEAQAMRAADSGVLPCDLALSTLISISDTLSKAFKFVLAQYGTRPILLAGGVASNQLIRARLENEFGDLVLFSDPKYATDNAVGIALMAKENY
ncbi:MAG: hypothetical protein II978_03315 [Clostridia bacterium]|nr:hypothetical protein [Clostridia bacterium]